MTPPPSGARHVLTAFAVALAAITCVDGGAGGQARGLAHQRAVRGVRLTEGLWEDARILGILTLRLELFNALNRRNYQLPDSFVDRATFGSALAASPPRQAQVAARFAF